MSTKRCKHFTGIMSEVCELGIRYADVQKDHEPIQYVSRGVTYTRTRSFPCIPTMNSGGAVCDKCELPTPEEVAAEEAETKKAMENFVKARAAIVAHLGGPWKKGMKSSGGHIDCPVCGKPGALAFSRSGYNGHVHARCATEGCVAWME